MLDDVEFFSNTEKMDAAYCAAQEVFGEHKPYTYKRTLSGKVLVFNSHFTKEAVAAFTTNCLSKLSQEEEAFLLHFIDWQNFLLTDPQNPIIAGSVEDTYVSATGEKAELEAFNNWLVDELAGTPHPKTC